MRTPYIKKHKNIANSLENFYLDLYSRCFFVNSPALTVVTAIQRYHCQRHLQSSLLAPQEICPLLLMKTRPSLLQHLFNSIQFNTIFEKAYPEP